MRRAPVGRIVLTAALLPLLLSGCGVPGLHSHRPTASSRPDRRSGPAAAWTTRLEDPTPGEIGMAGQTLMIPSNGVVRGFDSRTGRQLWHRGIAKDNTIPPSVVEIANAAVVVQPTANGAMEVLDPAAGTTRWRLPAAPELTVYQNTIYDDECAGSACALVARRIADGAVLWKTATGTGAVPDKLQVDDNAVGLHIPYAPPDAPFLVANGGDIGHTVVLLDARNGHVVASNLPWYGWFALPTPHGAVITDNDPPESDSRCTVTLDAINTGTGTTTTLPPVFSSRNHDGPDAGKCDNWFTTAVEPVQIPGDGTRLVAVTDTGLPELDDLTTGRTVWTAAQPAAPVDNDSHTVLVRRSTTTGPLTALDVGTGKARWSAPDPGIPSTDEYWFRTAVTSTLVAVTAQPAHDQAVDDHVVLVYDAATGRRLARLPGDLLAAGDTWVAVDTTDAHDNEVVAFVPFG